MSEQLHVIEGERNTSILSSEAYSLSSLILLQRNEHNMIKVKIF